MRWLPTLILPLALGAGRGAGEGDGPAEDSSFTRATATPQETEEPVPSPLVAALNVLSMEESALAVPRSDPVHTSEVLVALDLGVLHAPPETPATGAMERARWLARTVPSVDEARADEIRAGEHAFFLQEMQALRTEDAWEDVLAIGQEAGALDPGGVLGVLIRWESAEALLHTRPEQACAAAKEAGALAASVGLEDWAVERLATWWSANEDASSLDHLPFHRARAAAYEGLGDRPRVAEASKGIGLLLQHHNDFAGAVQWLTEAERIQRETGVEDPKVLSSLGHALSQLGRYREALAWSRAGLEQALQNEVGAALLSGIRLDLANVCAYVGLTEEAVAQYLASAEEQEEPTGRVRCIVSAADVLAARGRQREPWVRGVEQDSVELLEQTEQDREGDGGEQQLADDGSAEGPFRDFG